MLPNATTEQKIASGFHRNAMTNEEGGVDPEESRYEVLVDRVNTTATVWLGTTLACAQCHNHKYDPFSQKDYFRFLAFFANSDFESRTFGDGTRYFEPALDLATPEQEKARKELQAKIDQIDQELKSVTPAIREAQERWEQSMRSAHAAWTPLAPHQVSATNGVVLTVQPDGSVLASGPNPPLTSYTRDGGHDADGHHRRAPRGRCRIRRCREAARDATATDTSASPAFKSRRRPFPPGTASRRRLVRFNSRPSKSTTRRRRSSQEICSARSRAGTPARAARGRSTRCVTPNGSRAMPCWRLRRRLASPKARASPSASIISRARSDRASAASACRSRISPVRWKAPISRHGCEKCWSCRPPSAAARKPKSSPPCFARRHRC